MAFPSIKTFGLAYRKRFKEACSKLFLMDKGVYCLLMFLKRSQSIRINKRLSFFPEGYYCYVGSALNSLEKRVMRHRSKNKKLHWHIDHFLKKSKIIRTYSIVTDKKLECWLSRKIRAQKGEVIMKGFGSTDCKCETHLYYFKQDPSKSLARVFK